MKTQAQSEIQSTTNIVIIGFGNMGKALAKGLQRKGIRNLMVSDQVHPPSHAELENMGIDPSEIAWVEPSSPALKSPTNLVVILATKPQNLEAVAESWGQVLKTSKLVVSILAGIPTSTIEKLISAKVAVVRAMPNIAATVDCAATVICGGTHTQDQHLTIAKDIFDAVGKTWVAQEEHLNAVTGLSGSGPAYIYMVIEALSDGGVKMGLPRQLALDLATQTVIGAGILVQETKAHPAVLRDQVTTPGGTTISAIHELERHGLRAMLIQAVVTATRRSALLLEKTLNKLGKPNC